MGGEAAGSVPASAGDRTRAPGARGPGVRDADEKVWQWKRNGSGCGWKNYSDDVQADLRAAFAAGKEKASIVLMGRVYEVRFGAGLQVNPATGSSLNVRCCREPGVVARTSFRRTLRRSLRQLYSFLTVGDNIIDREMGGVLVDDATFLPNIMDAGFRPMLPATKSNTSDPMAANPLQVAFPGHAASLRRPRGAVATEHSAQQQPQKGRIRSWFGAIGRRFLRTANASLQDSSGASHRDTSISSRLHFTENAGDQLVTHGSDRSVHQFIGRYLQQKCFEALNGDLSHSQLPSADAHRPSRDRTSEVSTEASEATSVVSSSCADSADGSLSVATSADAPLQSMSEYDPNAICFYVVVRPRKTLGDAEVKNLPILASEVVAKLRSAHASRTEPENGSEQESQSTASNQAAGDSQPISEDAKAPPFKAKGQAKGKVRAPPLEAIREDEQGKEAAVSALTSEDSSPPQGKGSTSKGKKCGPPPPPPGKGSASKAWPGPPPPLGKAAASQATASVEGECTASVARGPPPPKGKGPGKGPEGKGPAMAGKGKCKPAKVEPSRPEKDDWLNVKHVKLSWKRKLKGEFVEGIALPIPEKTFAEDGEIEVDIDAFKGAFDFGPLVTVSSPTNDKPTDNKSSQGKQVERQKSTSKSGPPLWFPAEKGDRRMDLAILLKKWEKRKEDLLQGIIRFEVDRLKEDFSRDQRYDDFDRLAIAVLNFKQMPLTVDFKRGDTPSADLKTFFGFDYSIVGKDTLQISELKYEGIIPEYNRAEMAKSDDRSSLVGLDQIVKVRAGRADVSASDGCQTLLSELEAWIKAGDKRSVLSITFMRSEMQRLLEPNAEETWFWETIPEGFCRDICRIPSAVDKFTCLRIQFDLERKFASWEAQLRLISMAIDDIRGCQPLIRTFRKILYMGNCLNAGSDTGRADGYDVVSLIETLNNGYPKGADKKTSLLQHVHEKQLSPEDREGLAELKMQLASTPAGDFRLDETQRDVGKTARDSLNTLESCLNQAIGTSDPSQIDHEPLLRFEEVVRSMKEQLNELETTIASLRVDKFPGLLHYFMHKPDRGDEHNVGKIVERVKKTLDALTKEVPRPSPATTPKAFLKTAPSEIVFRIDTAD